MKNLNQGKVHLSLLKISGFLILLAFALNGCKTSEPQKPVSKNLNGNLKLMLTGILEQEILLFPGIPMQTLIPIELILQ